MNVKDDNNSVGSLGEESGARCAESQGDRCPLGEFDAVLNRVMEYAAGNRALAADWLGISSETLDLLLAGYSSPNLTPTDDAYAET